MSRNSGLSPFQGCVPKARVSAKLATDHAATTGWSIRWRANRRQARTSASVRSGSSSRISSGGRPRAGVTGARFLPRNRPFSLDFLRFLRYCWR